MDYAGLIAGGLLTWLLGIAFVAALPRRKPMLPLPGAIPWVLGTGVFAGQFLVTLIMRALSRSGIPFSAAAILVPATIALLALGIVAWRREGRVVRAAMIEAARTASGEAVSGAWRVLWYALLAWLAMRFALLLVEVVLRPVYPWDAWIQWATKARVWYELGTLAPFERADAWFAAGGTAYFDASPNYPATVPLMMVWANITLGRWDDALMNLPFWQLAVGFCLAIYGVLRAQGYGPAGSLIGAWIATSLPLANVHVALAGYADLPLAFFFALAALAGLRWASTREPGDGLLALLFVVACPLIKIPGVAWALALAPGLLVALLGRKAIRVVFIGFACLGVALIVLARTNPTIMGYALHLDFAPAWGSLLSSFFLLGNWNLLWYGVIAMIILGRRQLTAPALAPLSMVIAASFLFLFVVFGFTNAREWVADQTTINRAALHMAPLTAIWLLLLFREWRRASEESAAAVAVTAPATAPAIS